MAGLKKINISPKTLGGTARSACPCQGNCEMSTKPDKNRASWFATSRKISKNKTVTVG